MSQLVDILAVAKERLRQREQQRKLAAVSVEELQGGGAPPMDPAMAGGMPADPAMIGGAPPMDPAMMGGAPPMDPAMMGGAPPVDPAMMAGGMPPMDPAMMAGGMPPMDPAMMDPAMMDPAAAGDEAPAEGEEDPATLQLQYLEEILKVVTQVRTMMAAIVDSGGIQIPTQDLLEMDFDPSKNAEPKKKTAASLPPEPPTTATGSDGRPAMPSILAMDTSGHKRLDMVCRVAARHFGRRS